jgi:gluconolactonase
MKWRFVVTALVVCFTLAKLCVAQKEPKREFQLQANNPNFWTLFEREAKLETVASGFGFTEGPVWDPAGFVYVSDEETNKIFRVYMDGRKEELISLGDPDGNTYDHEKRLIDCASVLRAIIRIDRGGKYGVLAERFEGKRFNSPNDVVTGPDGAIYFTDPTLDLPKGEKQEIPFQGVYRLDASGNVSLLTKELSQPNGLAFSPDGKRWPNSAMVCSNKLLQAAGSVTSAGKYEVRRPIAGISPQAGPESLLRPWQATSAPASARATAMAAPIPRREPETNAVLPWR